MSGPTAPAAAANAAVPVATVATETDHAEAMVISPPPKQRPE